MSSSLHKWLKISLFNLWIVSLLGITLRYKIAFSLPFIHQKNLLHSHSHFAFAGWITQALMFLLIQQLTHSSKEAIYKKYKWILYSNLITAYGMLLSFPIEGYGTFSILFSTLSIFVSYWFAIVYWKDLNRQPTKKISHYWFKAAVSFNALSSIGAFGLAYIMVKKIMIQKWALLAVYFFLHFQYNGWFFFACMGLLTAVMESVILKQNLLLKIFYCFLIASVPAFFLSALWLHIPFIVYVLIIAASLLQLAGWLCTLKCIINNKQAFLKINPVSKTLFVISAFALLIKLVLQALSTIPSLGDLAFGFRPIVIGYLHLVLLGVITIFLISYMIQFEISLLSKKLRTGIYIFVTGIILNEVVLMLQGLADLSYISIPLVNEILFAIALIIFIGLAQINYSILLKKKNEDAAVHT